MPATYEPIATTTLGSAASSITFSSIPGTYTDLRVVIVGQNTASQADTWMLINNTTTGTLYSQTSLFGEGSIAESGSDTSTNSGIRISGNGSVGITVSPYWTLFEIDLFSYAGSTNKTCLISAAKDKNGSGGIVKAVGLFRSTSAINQLTFQNGSGNFAIGTTATLYGILKA